MSTAASIAKRWKLLSGVGKWEGLLDPLDVDLRRYIIHYGERAQATYDAFNREKVSRYAGSCLYAKSNLFSRVGLEKHNPFKYRVTKYLYATASAILPDSFLVKPLGSGEAWSKESNWIGYVAVATDEGRRELGRRDILIAWRGTIRDLEWVKDLQFLLVPAPEIFRGDDGPMIHYGWRSIYTSNDPESNFSKTSVRTQVLEEVTNLLQVYKDEETSITVTGHSLGASLATLNAVDIVTNGYNNSSHVTAFAFASPRVGNERFGQLFSSLESLHLLRISNKRDIVPTYPLLYTNVGEEMMVDSDKSVYLQRPGTFQSWHNLEIYLHLVAGTQGRGSGDFKLEVDRDIALVNKRIEGLKEEYRVPVSWWVEKNKGMAQKDDGSWELMDHEDDNL